LTNLKNLNTLDENLDAAKSRLKSFDFKNLHQEKKSPVLMVEKILELLKSWS
jgi:hypothetical protein